MFADKDAVKVACRTEFPMHTHLCRLALSCFILILSLPAFAASEQRIAAIVNDSIISLQDLNNRLNLVLLTSRIPNPEQARARLSQQILRQLIDETLQRQEAERLSITADQDEIDREAASIAERNKMSSDQMVDLFRQNDINPNTLFEQIRAQISWFKVVARELRPKVNVTVDQLELAVQEARLNQGQPEFLISEIVLPVDNPGDERRIAADAMRLVETLSEGASFDALARQVSAASTARNGGDLGWVQASKLPSELADRLDQLRPGEVSEPMRTQVGFFIFQLRDRRLSKTAPGGGEASDEVRLSQILFEANANDQAAISTRMIEANSLRSRLSDCGAVEIVAQELAAPASGDLGWLKVSDLPAVLANGVASLPVGQISEPLEGPAGVHLLMVCERRNGEAVQPSFASEEERQKLTESLERERLERLARRYLRDLRKQAFIDVRL